MKINHFLFCAAVLSCCASTVVRATEITDDPDATAESLVNQPLIVTPLVMQTVRRPVPVKGGDGRYHLEYELQLDNYSGDDVTADQLHVLDAATGTVVGEFNAAKLAARLVVRDTRAVPGQLGASQLGLLYVHVIAAQLGDIPKSLDHRLTMTSNNMTVAATAARLPVDVPTNLVIDPPLRGQRFIAGDGCCDSTRHIRATLAINGRAFTAQRFAIDWEAVDANGRIYVGNPKDPKSYIIYNKPAYAVADARVIAAVGNLKNSPIGSFPLNLPIDQADGNHVVLDLGGGHYALYAHFAPYSVQVHVGQNVHRGQVLGMVGTSGNSSEPHLHFQVTDGPSTLLSDGLPYLLPKFHATRAGASTKAFDQAIIDGKPIATVPLAGPADHEQELPLDLWIVDLPD